MSGLPFDDLRDLFSTGINAESHRSEEVRVSFYIDAAADRELVLAVRNAFSPELPGGHIHVELISGTGEVRVHPSCDLVVVVCGEGSAATSRCVRRVLLSGIPCVSVCRKAVDAPSIGAAAVARGHYGIVAANNPDDIPPKLARWISRNSNKTIAFAANFAFVRDAVSDRFVDEVAIENAAIGAFMVVPGGDFALMVLNDAKLAFDISALYGEPLSLDRLGEFVWIFGAGWVMRLFSRGFSHFLPLPKWLVNGFMAWAGTQIIGQAINARLSSDESFIEMARRLFGGAFAGSAQDSVEVEAQDAPGQTERLPLLAEAAS